MSTEASLPRAPSADPDVSLRARASEAKRIAIQLREEFGLPAVSSSLMIGVGGDGGLRLIVTASVTVEQARQILRTALDAGVVA